MRVIIYKLSPAEHYSKDRAGMLIRQHLTPIAVDVKCPPDTVEAILTELVWLTLGERWHAVGLRPLGPGDGVELPSGLVQIIPAEDLATATVWEGMRIPAATALAAVRAVMMDVTTNTQ